MPGGEQDKHNNAEAERLGAVKSILSAGGGEHNTTLPEPLFSLKAAMKESSSKACFEAEVDSPEKTAIHWRSSHYKKDIR